MLALLHRANIRNYSIFHGNGLLFTYMEYTGADYEGDMAAIADDPRTRKWWQLTDPLQHPVESNSSRGIEGNWWKNMEILFLTE